MTQFKISQNISVIKTGSSYWFSWIENFNDQINMWWLLKWESKFEILISQYVILTQNWCCFQLEFFSQNFLDSASSSAILSAELSEFHIVFYKKYSIFLYHILTSDGKNRRSVIGDSMKFRECQQRAKRFREKPRKMCETWDKKQSAR